MYIWFYTQMSGNGAAVHRFTPDYDQRAMPIESNSGSRVLFLPMDDVIHCDGIPVVPVLKLIGGH